MTCPAGCSSLEPAPSFYPSLYEGFGLPVLEAMAMWRSGPGVQRIRLTITAGGRWRCRQSLVDPCDVDAIARAMSARPLAGRGLGGTKLSPDAASSGPAVFLRGKKTASRGLSSAYAPERVARRGAWRRGPRDKVWGAGWCLPSRLKQHTPESRRPRWWLAARVLLLFRTCLRTTTSRHHYPRHPLVGWGRHAGRPIYEAYFLDSRPGLD